MTFINLIKNTTISDFLSLQNETFPGPKFKINYDKIICNLINGSHKIIIIKQKLGCTHFVVRYCFFL